MAQEYEKMQTKLVHAGEPHPRADGALVQPIYQSSTYEFTRGVSYHDTKYIRLSNSPNHITLGRKLAAVENAEAALACASGMAAISTALLSFLGAGDHAIFHNSLYGGTNDLITKDFPDLGIEASFVDACKPETWKQHLRENTKIFYVETITNPTLVVADLPAVVEFARANGLISMIDNTFASPVNFRPAEHGFDLSLHSATKYLNGHTDIAAGAVIGRADLLGKITHRLNHLGGSIDPNTCFLLNRGMKTLALRVRQQNESALALARFLHEHPAVSEVKYPGLPSHPNHERAKALLDGFGGMISFEVKGGQETALQVMSRMKIAVEAPSLGGLETLVSVPALVSHSGLTAEERQRSGISDGLIRVSVGIEDTSELIEDFKQAMET
jgi:cystathionine beta-lyase/cystathionine gamma-synthase